MTLLPSACRKFLAGRLRPRCEGMPLNAWQDGGEKGPCQFAGGVRCCTALLLSIDPFEAMTIITENAAPSTPARDSGATERSARRGDDTGLLTTTAPPAEVGGRYRTTSTEGTDL